MKLDPRTFNFIVIICVGVWGAALLCPVLMDLTQLQVTQANMAALAATGLLTGLGVSKGQKGDDDNGGRRDTERDDKTAG